jgi:UDP-glucose 4-epimerase
MDKSTYLIIGGTGTIGKALVNSLLKKENVKEIRVFSRDDKKQIKMQREYPDKRIRYYIGDIKDRESVDRAMKDVDFVLHTAALMLVPFVENFPLEGVKTNIFGTLNVLRSSFEHNIKKIVILSTDKVVYPLSAYGATKMLMEKIILSETPQDCNTKVVLTRFGNVLNSYGSVVDVFMHNINSNIEITVNGKDMTRFIMTQDEAVNLVLYALLHGEHKSTYIAKMVSISIDFLAQALKKIFNSNVPILYKEPRFGDKLSERLVSLEEEYFILERENYYIISSEKNNHPFNISDSFFNPLTLSETEEYFRSFFYLKNKRELYNEPK